MCKPEEVIAQLASMLIRSQLDQVSYLGHTLAKMLINEKRLRYEKVERLEDLTLFCQEGEAVIKGSWIQPVLT